MDASRSQETLGRPVLLSAGFPPEADESPAKLLLEIEEAILSLCRAVFARGGEIVVPADPAVAPLAAMVGAEYADPPAAERGEHESRPLVHVLMCDGIDRSLDVLRLLPHVQLRPYRDEEVEPGTRQQLTPDAVERIEPVGAVIVGGAEESRMELDILRKADVPVSVIAPALAGELRRDPRLLELDVADEILGEIDWGRERDEGGREHGREVEPQPFYAPYSYLMQTLVQRWVKSSGRFWD